LPTIRGRFADFLAFTIFHRPKFPRLGGPHKVREQAVKTLSSDKAKFLGELVQERRKFPDIDT
jgi:hypothetical protein